MAPSVNRQISVESIVDFVLDNQVITTLYHWLPNLWDFERTGVVVVGFAVNYFLSLAENTYDDILFYRVKKNCRVSGRFE